MKFCLLFVIIALAISEQPEDDLGLEIARKLFAIAQDYAKETLPANIPFIDKQLHAVQSETLGHPEVNTSSGVVIGTSHSESHSFYSIPYGQAPVGDLR